jgi:hypothetical protein
MKKSLLRMCGKSAGTPWRIIAFLFVLAASPALADGDGPTRKMNASESAAFQALQAALRSALPAPAAGYVAKYTGFEEREVPQALTEGKMLWMTFNVLYKPDAAVFQKQMQSAMMDKVKGTPRQQEKRAALEARERELYNARKSTRDPGEKEKIRTQLKAVRVEASALDDEISAQYQEWVRQGGQTTMLQNVSGAMPPEVSVQVLVNQSVYLGDKAIPFPVEGATLAFEQGNCGDSRKYCLTVLLGPFEKGRKGSHRYELQNAGGGVSTKVRGMGVIFSGPKDKAPDVKALLKKTDLARLKALL